MSDDITTNEDDQDEVTTVAHDDIMKRLLDYQRNLREGAGSEIGNEGEIDSPLVDYSAIEAQAAMATATEDLVDLTDAEGSLDEDEDEAGIEVGIEVVEIEEITDVIVVEEISTSEEAAVSHAPEAIEKDPAGAIQEPETRKPKAKGKDAADTEPTIAEEEAAEATPAEGLRARIARLEDSLDRITLMLAAVRSDFQDLAIRADERIAEVEDAIARVRAETSA